MEFKTTISIKDEDKLLKKLIEHLGVDGANENAEELETAFYPALQDYLQDLVHGTISDILHNRQDELHMLSDFVEETLNRMRGLPRLYGRVAQ